ncbi:uncharacterized protein LOC110465445 [Mizuhopecten yessoensis]|uniref:uncharacterized protein LOC110465445 n=1 Tax=Mizuhopecten yessoensis TaxID=6573 RepID=UPI000B45D9A5|nr:uncharacterized protein LOC110465445 [Mizuhopecten yessoensis]
MQAIWTSLICLGLVVRSGGYILPDTRSCVKNGDRYLIGDEVHISSRITCVCLLASSTGKLYLGGCAFGNRARRQGFPTPAPPSTSTRYTTKSPPPFTTRAPPSPIGTRGPAEPSTRGTTLAPPPIG